MTSHPASSRWVVVACGLWIALLASGFVLADAYGKSAAAESVHTVAPPTADQIAEWIGQLGHDSFTVRQAAAERLLAGGNTARVALVEMIDAPDPEVRAAARRLVALIEQSEFDRRLAEFAADVDGERGVTLPGWAEFSGLVGSDVAAREMFVDMQRCEATLLASVFRDDALESEVSWEERLVQLQRVQRGGGQRTVAPPMGSYATMFFLGCLDKIGGTEQAANQIAQLAQQPTIREAVLGTGPQQVLVRRLLLTWIKDCPVHSNGVLQSRLTLITLYKLNEALPLAVAVVRGDPPYLTAASGNRVMAVLVIGRFGSADNVDDLDSLLSDDTVWASTGQLEKARTIQVRDVALATMIHLSGQQPQDYGFAGLQRNPQLLFSPQSLAMSDDDARTAAIAKWREWRAANHGTGN